jgi:hypothetical protein
MCRRPCSVPRLDRGSLAPLPGGSDASDFVGCHSCTVSSDPVKQRELGAGVSGVGS